MELILFIGLQATGKSTFYRERFFGTHVSVNLDMLKTLHSQAPLLPQLPGHVTRFSKILSRLPEHR